MAISEVIVGTSSKLSLKKINELQNAHVVGLVTRSGDNGAVSFGSDTALISKTEMEQVYIIIKQNSTTTAIEASLCHFHKENIDHPFVGIDVDCLDLQDCEIIIAGTIPAAMQGKAIQLEWIYEPK